MSNLYFESESMPDEEDDVRVIEIIADWVRTYLAKPHPDLGRKGSVCPFVPEAITRNTLKIKPIHLLGDRLAEMEAAVVAAKEAFELARGDRFQAVYHSTLLVFPELADEAGFLAVEQVKDRLKPTFVDSGLMLGEFYETNCVSGLHNENFYPLRSPLPMLVIRHMVPSDLVFLDNKAYSPELRVRYLKSYLAHQKLPVPERKRITAILAELSAILQTTSKQTADLHRRVLQHLQSAGATFQVLRHGSCANRIKTPVDFAQCLGWPVERIAKTLLVKSKTKPIQFAAITLPAPHRADLKAVSVALQGMRLEFATPEDLFGATDYPLQGVSPLGLENIRVVIDEELMRFPTITVGGGAIGIEVEISPSLLAAITKAVVQPISLS